jgi:hypothetical protein
MSFEANRGQYDSQVKFLSRGGGYNLFLTSTEAVLVTGNSRPAPQNKGLKDRRETLANPHRAKDSVPVRMKLVGGNSRPRVTGLAELPGKTNYFNGSDPRKWQANIANYGKVKYSSVYPGVDIIYYGNQQQLEYDILVSPGADPKLVKFDFQGAQRIRVDKNGDLVLTTNEGELRQLKPNSYQIVDGVKRAIVASYVLNENNQVGFRVGDYDKSRQLVIDPILAYSTYLGGGYNDGGRSVAVDANGSAYVLGYTTSVDFPTANSLQTANAGSYDVFVTKLNPQGTQLVYSSYLGGANDDSGAGIAVDATGNVYLTGSTQSADFPTTVNAYDRTCGTDGNCDANGYGPTTDAFVAKLNPTGSALVYSTYLGGDTWDSGVGIGVDGNDNAYVAGRTASANFPTASPLQAANGGGNEVFLTRLAANGATLVYSTYLGGTGDDYCSGVAVETSGAAYLTGFTSSGNFPVANALQSTYSGAPFADAFVSKLVFEVNPGTGLPELRLDYSTYLGGTGDDVAKGIAVNSSGDVFIAGMTESTDFPVANPYQATKGADRDAFVSKLVSTIDQGTGLPVLSLTYSTYLGGDGYDEAYGISVNASGDAYLTGYTWSSNFPTVNSLRSDPVSGVMIAKLNATGSALLYSTYLASGYGYGITVDAAGAAYVTGETDSAGFPTASAIQPNRSGYNDAFLLKLADTNGFSISGQVTDINGPNPYYVTMTLSGSESRTILTDAAGNYSFNNVGPGGNYTVTPSVNGPYGFSPISQSVNNLSSNQTFNFTGAPLHTISGRITDFGGADMYGVTVTLSGSQADTVQTDYAGIYTFYNVPGGGNYTVTPSKPTYAFSPASQTLNNLSGDQTAINFTGNLSYTIDGRVVDPNNTGVSGVTITLLRDDDGSVQTVQTDANGNYSFPAVVGHKDYFVTPSKLNHIFTPSTQSVPWIYQNTTVDFAAIPPFSIRGQVAGAGVVTMTLSGSQGGSIQTDANGNYCFWGLASGGNYTVTPSKATYVFVPGNATFTSLAENQTVNFSGVPPFNVSGRVTNAASAPISGVTITLSGNGTQQVTTNANGDYSFANVVGGFTYTLTPSKTGYLFTPASQAFPNLLANPNANFTGRLVYTISGRAADNNGVGINAATITLSGAQTGVAQTDANGNYSFVNLDQGANFWLAASKTGYSFYPLNQFIANLNSNQTANFVSGTAGTILLNPIADAHVRDGASASTNFGTATLLEVRTTGTANDGNNRDAYFKFDLSTAGSIGTVKLRTYASLSASGTVATSAYPVAVTSWIESGAGSITWSNKPALGTALGSVSVTGTTYAWYEIDVTSYIKSELAAGRTVVSLALHDTASSTPNLRINSREATSNKPELLITPEAVTNTAPVVNAGPDQTLALPSSVTLDATVSDDGLPSPPAALTFTWTKVSGPGTVNFSSPNASDTAASFSTTGTYVLQLQASDSVLSATDQVQVIVNPDPTILNLLPTADAYVRDGSANANTNFGTATTLSVSTDTVVNSGNNRDAYFKFDTTSAGSAANVVTAKVRFFGALSAAGTVNTSVYSVATTTWIESGTGSITWNNKPARGPSPLSSVSVTGTTSAWYELDVTNYIKSEKTAGRHVVSLAIHDAAAATPIINLNSKEAATNKPVLVITQAPSTAPKIITMSPSYGLAGTAVTVSGLNFGASQGSSTIKFNGVTATATAWNANSISTTVPAGAATGPVIVTVGGVNSVGAIFTVAATDADSDTDGMMDSWERMYFGGLTQTAAGDFDGDGLTNLLEFQQGRNPTISTVFDTMLAVSLKVLTPLEFIQ